MFLRLTLVLPCCLFCMSLCPKHGPCQGGSAPTCAMVISAFTFHRLHGTIQAFSPILLISGPGLRRELAALSVFPASGSSVSPVPASNIFSPRLWHPMFLQQLLGLPTSGTVVENIFLLLHGVDCLFSSAPFPYSTYLGEEEPFPRFSTGQHHTLDGYLVFLSQNAGLSQNAINV